MTQEKFDDAIDNYLEISKMVKDDLRWMLDIDDGSEIWRRAFIRSSIPLIEAYCASLRGMVRVTLDNGFNVSNKDAKAIEEEKSCSAEDRIKRNIKSAYEVFGIKPAPNFNCDEWALAKNAIKKRGELMHPISPKSLELPEILFNDYREGISWVVELLFAFIEKLVIKYR